MLLKQLMIAFMASYILPASAAAIFPEKAVANHERIPGKDKSIDAHKLSSRLTLLLDAIMKASTKQDVHVSPELDQKRDAEPETPAIAHAGTPYRVEICTQSCARYFVPRKVNGHCTCVPQPGT